MKITAASYAPGNSDEAPLWWCRRRRAILPAPLHEKNKERVLGVRLDKETRGGTKEEGAGHLSRRN